MMTLETDKIEYTPKVDYGKKNSDGCTSDSVEHREHLTANDHSGNRTSQNLLYLNEIIDQIEFDIDFNYFPFRLPKIFKRKEKSLEDKITDSDRDENGIPYSSPP